MAPPAQGGFNPNRRRVRRVFERLCGMPLRSRLSQVALLPAKEVINSEAYAVAIGHGKDQEEQNGASKAQQPAQPGMPYPEVEQDNERNQKQKAVHQYQRSEEIALAFQVLQLA